MLLSHIKQYLRERQAATLEELALHFDTDQEAMRGMLDHWIRKGHARKQMETVCCKGCSHCETPRIEVYEWITPSSEYA